MNTRLIAFTIKNNILTEGQHGFRQDISIETAIHEFLFFGFEVFAQCAR